MPPKRKAKDAAASPARPSTSRARQATIEQHLMDQNKKSKAFLQGFKDQVAQARDQLHETLAGLKRDLAKPSHNTATGNDNNHPTASGMFTALQAAAAAAAQSSPSTKDNNPLFEQTQALLRLSRAILACHRTVEQQSRHSTENLSSPRETWAQDEDGMRKLLEYGRLYGERAVEGWITPRAQDDKACCGEEDDDESNSEEEREKLSEAENLAKGLFEWRRKGRGLLLGKAEESWGVAARRQMGALVGVVRTLPSKRE
ncbi:hypothetical protein N658DRAFT_516031 [Parathielavia hyrcaniae]|uniref:Uncharacterized protein n=1 Tax=Parathielavia hyrcaniae TaxID=113614 RepID=A0AAN6Q0X2_9PEZI|nr:hypothetical protein N658DRAFT_516031 [Parathielavia hyrcaniae]